MSLHINRWTRLWWYLKTKLIYRKEFYSIGAKSIIFKPMQFSETQSVNIGNSTFIAHYGWIMGGQNKNIITLLIGNNVQIGHFSHIIAKNRVIIENSVLIADKVYISDCEHEFLDIDNPILDQGLRYVGDVLIGEGSWIGENVCIIGAKIGKHCIIGANAVVNKDIPDYSIAVGVPAKVVKKYDFNIKGWVRVNGIQ